MINLNNLFFTVTGELSLQGQSLYVDAMLLNRVADLPHKVYECVQNTPLLLTKIVQTYSLLSTQDLPKPHPFFDEYLPIYQKQKRKAFLALDACESYPIYEQALNYVYRAQAHVSMQQPKNGAFVQDEIRFHWTGGCPKLTLQVENNDLEQVLQTEIANRKVLWLSPEKFPDGLYYFKLLHNNQLQKMGKFYVYRSEKL